MLFCDSRWASGSSTELAFVTKTPNSPPGTSSFSFNVVNVVFGFGEIFPFGFVFLFAFVDVNGMDLVIVLRDGVASNFGVVAPLAPVAFDVFVVAIVAFVVVIVAGAASRSTP